MSVREPDEGGQTGLTGRQLLTQLSLPVRRFVATEAASAVLLLAATVAALVWANSPWSETYEALLSAEASVSVAGATFAMDVEHWINDGLMALFFFVVGLEVRREFSIGELTHRRRAVIPVIAALGGVVLPTLLFLALAPPTRATAGESSWAPTRPSCSGPWPSSGRGSPPSCGCFC